MADSAWFRYSSGTVTASAEGMPWHTARMRSRIASRKSATISILDKAVFFMTSAYAEDMIRRRCIGDQAAPGHRCGGQGLVGYSDEFISMLKYRDDKMGLAFQRGAQPSNMHVNGAITVNLLCFRPRQFEQLFAR
jgi:hypothetical protein